MLPHFITPCSFCGGGGLILYLMIKGHVILKVITKVRIIQFGSILSIWDMVHDMMHDMGYGQVFA